MAWCLVKHQDTFILPLSFTLPGIELQSPSRYLPELSHTYTYILLWFLAITNRSLTKYFRNRKDLQSDKDKAFNSDYTLMEKFPL
jgi:hypothetical protein